MMKSFRRIGVVCAAVLVGGLAPIRTVAAQIEGRADVDLKHPLQTLGASSIGFDARTKTVTIPLRNPSADTVAAQLYFQFGPPAPPPPATAGALLDVDQAVEDSIQREQARMDSVGKIWSLESWVREPLPVKIWIKPHQTVMVTLHFTVPDSLPPGEYSAHFVVQQLVIGRIPMSFGLGGMVMSGVGYMFLPPRVDILPPVAVKLSYRAGRSVE